ncbi:MAG TPA: AraC family transcriptional regulator [Luteibacter sp.]|jgi:AraC family transcriptional regulator|nr:AraC family transcriptional regulator [Luteibacter sp.]
MTGSYASRVHVSRYAPGSVLAPHHHGEPWLCLVLDGGYREGILARERDHAAGDLLFCPAFAPHRQAIGGKGAVKLLFSPAPGVLDYLLERGIPLEHAPSVMRSRTLQRIGARLWRELVAGDAFAPMAVEGLALELVAAFGREQSLTGPPEPPSWLRRVKDRLDSDLAMPLSLADLAHDAQRHPVHVARSFREHYGITVGEYARRVRAEKAASMLRSGTQPLIEIALDCGYASASQFSRSFKAAFGVLPSAYRTGSR